MRTLILAGSYNEAAKYARGKGLKAYRYAVNAAGCEKYAAQAVVELPGYQKRLDKFAIEAVVKRLTRRGVERVQDSYVPPAPEPGPAYGEAGYKADLTFGDVPVEALLAVLDGHNEDTLRELGASDEEIATFVGIEKTAERVQELQDTVQTSTKPRVNARKTAKTVANKVSGPGKTSEPKATNSPVIDDPFED